MLKLLLFLSLCYPSTCYYIQNGTRTNQDYMNYDGQGEWDDGVWDDDWYDEPEDKMKVNCSYAALGLAMRMDAAFKSNSTVSQKMASEMIGNCHMLKDCLEQGVLEYTSGERYSGQFGRNIEPLKFLQSSCTVLDSLTGPLGECFDKIGEHNKTELMANSWASLGINRKKEFENHKVPKRPVSCFSILNPYSQSIIQKDCAPEAVEELGKALKSMKYISCMLMGFFSLDDFYDYVDSI